MSESIPLAHDGLRRAAHSWVARLTVGSPTVEDAHALAAWREISPAHEEAYQEAVALWRALQPVAESLSLDSAQVRPLGLNRRALMGGAVAAGVAGLMLARPPYGLWPSLNDWLVEAEADYRTAPGEQQSIRLSPQVTVALNTRTYLKRDWIHPGAGAVLLRGEGLFTVAASAFTVQANGGHCTGRSASFDVRLDSEQSTVACLSGEVLVQRGNHSVVLFPDTLVTFVGDGLGQPVQVDLQKTTAWRRGEIIFRDTPLGEVIAELNRYRSGRVLLLSAPLAHRQVNGVFRINKLDDVLAQLEQGYGARVDRLPGGIVLVT